MGAKGVGLDTYSRGGETGSVATGMEDAPSVGQLPCLPSRCFSDTSESRSQQHGPSRPRPEQMTQSDPLAALWPPLQVWWALTCEGAGLIRGHSPQVAQVTLVAHQHDDDVAVSVVPQLLQPALHVLIRQVLGNVIYQQGAHCATVVPVRMEGRGQV